MKTVSLETARELWKVNFPWYGEGCVEPVANSSKPDVYDLLEQLPKIVRSFDTLIVHWQGRYKTWLVGYGQEDVGKVYFCYKHIINESLAEALAQLWLWCKREGYIKSG
jgi:hypothetical protein